MMLTDDELKQLEEIEALQARHDVHLRASGHYSDFGYQLRYEREWGRLRLDLADSVPFLLALVKRLNEKLSAPY